MEAQTTDQQVPVVEMADWLKAIEAQPELMATMMMAQLAVRIASKHSDAMHGTDDTAAQKSAVDLERQVIEIRRDVFSHVGNLWLIENGPPQVQAFIPVAERGPALAVVRSYRQSLAELLLVLAGKQLQGCKVINFADACLERTGGRR